MPKVSPLQGNFNGGELSPLYYGRVATDRYKESLMVCENYVPTIQGGLTRRPGTYYAGRSRYGATGSNDEVRLIPFEYSTTQAYVLELGHGYIRFYRDNAPVLEGSKTITGATQANPVVITSAGHGYSTDDEVEISGIVGMTQLNGRRFTITVLGANTFSLNSTNGTGYTAYSSGGVANRVYTLDTNYTSSQVWDIDYVQSADTLYLVHGSHMPAIVTRTAHTSWSIRDFFTSATVTVPYDGPYEPINNTATTVVSSGASGIVTLTASSAIFGSYDDTYFRIKNGANWTICVINSVGGGGTTANATVLSGTAPVAPTTYWRRALWYSGHGPSVVTFHEDRLCLGGAPNYPQRFDLSASGDYEMFPPSELDGTVVASNGISYTINAADVNNIKWLVSDEKGLLSGSVGNEWIVRPSSQGEALSPTNVNAKPASNYGSAGVKPVRSGKATLFVQRAGRKIREFQYFYDVDGFRAPDLSVLAEHVTESGIVQMAVQKEPQPIIWCVREDGELAAVTYQREQESVNAGWHRHIIGGVSNAAGDNAVVESVCVIPSPDGTREEVWLVVKRYINGAIVKHIEYMTKFFEDSDEQRDAFFVDAGLTYDNPLSVSAVVFQSGDVTYLEVASHGLSTGNQIKISDLAGTDALEALNGETYTITIINADNFSLDGTSSDATVVNSGLTVGSVRKLVSTISGLWHLEGQEVDILGDGSVQPSATVSNGSITLSQSAATVQVGLGYASKGQMLRLEAGAADGTALGKTRRTHRVGFLLHRTLGFKIGMDFTTMDNLVFRTSRDLQTRAPALFSGIISETVDADYDFENNIAWMQDQPLPGTILAVMPQMVTQDR